MAETKTVTTTSVATDNAHPRPRRPGRFARASVVMEWCRDYQSHLRHDAMALGIAAKLVEKELRKARGVDKAVAYIKAKRCAFYLHRAAAHTNAASDAMFKFSKKFQEQYAEQLHTTRRKATFDFD